MDEKLKKMLVKVKVEGECWRDDRQMARCLDEMKPSTGTSWEQSDRSEQDKGMRKP